MFTDTLTRTLLGLLSPAGSRSRLTILIFHRVLPAPDPLFPEEVDALKFDAIVAWLTRWFNVLPLQEAVQSLSDGSLPTRSACITFDDGYADNESIALPILQRHNANATFFIATGYLGGGGMWNDTIIEAVRNTANPVLHLDKVGAGSLPVATIEEKRQAIDHLIGLLKYKEHRERSDLAAFVAEQSGATLRDDLMMTDQSVQALHEAGMGIGAHTVDHPILSLCNEPEARRQIIESRDYLEGLIHESVNLFAYPNGKPHTDYTPDQARLVANLGFQAAVSTAPGASTAKDDRFQLRRFTPWDRSQHKFALRLVLNLRGRAA